MDCIEIKGGVPLKGTVKAAGAKNAITKLLVASLLSDKKCVFYNVPEISEVSTTLELCQEVGMEAIWDKDAGTIEAQTKELKSTYIHQKFSGANRIPILMIGALLGRTNEDIIVPTTGGCKIGKRPVNFHIDALKLLGADIEYREMRKEGAYLAHAHKGLSGTCIELPYSSVGATENVILAACRAKGTTCIKNVAVEPEIIDLIQFLQKLGVTIYFESDRTIIVKETKTFYEVEHHVITDRIEAASLGLAAIATKGRVFVEGANQTHMSMFLAYLREMGAGFEIKNNGIEFFYSGPLKAGLHIETNVHPGFLTDWQQPFVVLLTQAEGTSIIHETVYERRFGYVQTLQEMGANAQIFQSCLGPTPCRFKNSHFNHSLSIQGVTPLVGKTIEIPDLRAGFAYVLAALVAEGKSTITNTHYIDRGYEKLKEKLTALGAHFERKKISKNPLEALIPSKV